MAFTDDDKKLREGLSRRQRGLRVVRAGVDAHLADVSRFCQPRLGRYLAGYAAVAASSNPTAPVSIPQFDRSNDKLINARALWASETLANGMYSGLSSPARLWFKLTLSDPDMRRYQPVKEWLDEVERRLYAFFAKTNFYTAVKSGYLELGVFGTSACFYQKHWRYGGVLYPMTFGEYWIGLDDAGFADTLYRRIDMTAKQMVEKFGNTVPHKVRSAYDKGDYEKSFEVYHAVEPNTLRQIGRLDNRNKAFRSVYWCATIDEGRDDALLSLSGYDEKPFWAPRWDVVGSDTYGKGPGWNALSEARTLQLKELRKQQGIDYVLKPALAGPATLNNVHVALQPGRVTAMANVDRSTFGPIWEVDPSAITHISNDIDKTEMAVDRHFYADLFNAITNMPGIQPRNVEEIAARNEEKLTQLGPVVERVNNEQLYVAIDRAYEVLDEAGMLPPPPDELDGQEIAVEFISVLAQAQRLIGLGAIERYAGFLGSMAQNTGDTSVLDKIDMDKAADEYADIVGVPASLVRSDDDVAQIRGNRAQQEQAQAAVENAAALAPAAKQGMEAAKLLYDSPGVGSSPTLADRLLGTG